VRAGDTVLVEMSECAGRISLDIPVKEKPDEKVMRKCGITARLRG
jgi:hypothetical protein